MAWDQGLGSCLIPDDKGNICGRQIAEGEAIGTIILNGPRVGHKRCADAFHARLQASEREKRNEMVKRLDQGGPGGPIDYSSERDGTQGSIPLERSPGDPMPTPEGGPETLDPSLLAGLAQAAGVHNIADVPMDATPAQAAALAAQDLEARVYPDNGSPLIDISPPAFVGASPSPLPHIRANNGWIELIVEMPIESSTTDTVPFTVTLDPDDAEDLVNILQANIKRAWRQRR